MRRLVIVVACLLLARSASATTYNAATCSNTDVQTAVNMATAGDTVTIPAGACAWTAPVVMGYGGGVYLKGAGQASTIIDGTNTNIGSWGGPLVVPQPTAEPSNNRVSDFTLTCGAIDLGGTGWRIDHMTFTCPTAFVSIRASGYGQSSPSSSSSGTPSGVIDHSIFYNTTVLADGYPAESTYWNLEDGSTNWSTALGLGTNGAVYIEASTFSYTVTTPAVTCRMSGRYVFRYNTVVDGYLETVGVTNDGRGCRKFEIYANSFTNTANCCAPYNPIKLDGGTGVIYNNTVTGATYGKAYVSLSVLRATSSGGTIFGLCDGSSLWDSNQASNGSPCLDQIGRAIDSAAFDATPPPYPSQTTDPVYIWNNTINGTPLVTDYLDTASAARIIEGRDYFINKGAKPGYAAYTYPHPLQGGSPGPTPTPLSLSCVLINGEKMLTFVWSATGIILYGMVCP